ncbi:MAG: carbohydrate-binding family 9-like protein [Deltaproteobacteria bacterium]|nr:carbohydrate-binding family 9-like protein [Deltaproteobacteria bacterium]
MPDLIVPRRTSSIKIDGTLDEPAWKDAARTGYLMRSDGKEPARQHTEVKLTWDEEKLYLAFECEDEDIFSSYTRRDEPLYMQEVVEVFLDPDCDRGDYLEFEVSPAGIMFDASFTARRKGMKLSFNPSVQVAVKVDGTLNVRDDLDQGWTVELAIPFSQLTGRGSFPPQKGDQWRFNIFRIDKTGQSGEASSFRPTRGDFHDLNAFGTLRFSD